MTTWKQLSPGLRAALAAPWLLIVAAVALGSTPALRQVLIDAANQPTADVSLSSPHWTGTLDPDRLPAGVPQYQRDGSGALSLPGTLEAAGLVNARAGLLTSGLYVANGQLLVMDADGRLYYTNAGALTDLQGNLLDSGGNPVADFYGNRFVAGSLYGPAGLIVDAGGVTYVPNGLSVWGANAVAAPPPAIADATDLASVIAGFNALKADVAAYGFITQ